MISVHLILINFYEMARHNTGATEVNIGRQCAEILARWTVFTKAAIDRRQEVTKECRCCNN